MGLWIADCFLLMPKTLTATLKYLFRPIACYNSTALDRLLSAYSYNQCISQAVISILTISLC